MKLNFLQFFSDNHVIIGELLESKSTQQLYVNTPKTVTADANWNSDPEASQATGGFSIGFSLTVIQVLTWWH